MILKIMKKKLLFFCGILCLIICCVGASLAAYTSRSFVKGVASTPKQGLGLYSDYLSVASKSATEDTLTLRKIILNEKENDEPYSFAFYITNSLNGSNSSKNMVYKLYVSGLPEGSSVNVDGDNITVLATGESGYLSKMIAYTKAVHNYLISVPKNKLNEANSIVVKAIPDIDSDSSGNMLAARFQLSVAGVVAGFSYNGKFTDYTSDNHPYDFVAFNYEISVYNTTGDHEMLLSWNSDYLEIDPYFLDNVNVKIRDDKKSVNITMNEENSTYLVKFYRRIGRDKNDSTQQSWSNFDELVSLEKRQDEQKRGVE